MSKLIYQVIDGADLNVIIKGMSLSDGTEINIKLIEEDLTYENQENIIKKITDNIRVFARVMQREQTDKKYVMVKTYVQGTPYEFLKDFTKYKNDYNSFTYGNQELTHDRNKAILVNKEDAEFFNMLGYRTEEY